MGGHRQIETAQGGTASNGTPTVLAACCSASLKSHTAWRRLVGHNFTQRAT
jgi:hypothetical protein